MESDYIELKYETRWKKPIQVYSYFTNKYGETSKTHWFSEYYTFEQALSFLKRNHKCEIKINRQIAIGLL